MGLVNGFKSVGAGFSWLKIPSVWTGPDRTPGFLSSEHSKDFVVALQVGGAGGEA